MRLLRRRPSRDDLYREIIADKDKQIARLDAEVLVLRTHGPGAVVRVIPPPVADGQPAVLGSKWDSDADEAQDILTKNGLSKIHLSEILDGLGVGSSDLS